MKEGSALGVAGIEDHGLDPQVTKQKPDIFMVCLMAAAKVSFIFQDQEPARATVTDEMDYIVPGLDHSGADLRH